MSEREYRQDDRDQGYCPVCAKPLTGLTVAGRGYCEQHGWQWAEWNKPQLGMAGWGVRGDDGEWLSDAYDTPQEAIAAAKAARHD